MSNKNKILCRKTLFVLLIILLYSSALFSQTTFTVTSTGDGVDSQLSDGICNDGFGNCTFRAAIEQANYTSGVDTILFDIPGAGPYTLQPNYALPNVTESIVIDGTTEPDFAGSPIIELDGSNAGECSGLWIDAGNCIIRGLIINRFGDTGIDLVGSGGNTVEGNYIGTDTAGIQVLGNTAHGIRIWSPNNTIGGMEPGQGNLISGNGDNGIEIGVDATQNTILGNNIGTDASGILALGNQGGGLLVGSSNNIIGGLTEGARNIISGNGQGIGIGGIEADSNIISGNYIGTDVTGTSALGNTWAGITVQGGAQNTTIGGSTAGARNIISGNGDIGVIISNGANNTTLSGNIIGTDITGTAAIGNADMGIVLDSVFNNIIGGSTAGERNIISGNEVQGIMIYRSSSNVVKGNYIGTDVSGTIAIGNGNTVDGGAGLVLGSGSARNIIGGSTESERNIISGNLGFGIGVWNAGTNYNLIIGNYIGVDASGTELLGNAWSGIFIIDDADHNMVGGLDPGEGNIIAGHGDCGIEIRTIGNPVLSNSIHSNAVMGIELGVNDGPTLNDPGDADTGPNNKQNYPDVSIAEVDITGEITFEYFVDSNPAHSAYPLTVQFFKSDPVGNGQGRTLLFTESFTEADYLSGAKANHFAAGHGFDLSYGDFIVATATDLSGNTSEFSPKEFVIAFTDFSLSDTYFVPGSDSVFITTRMSSTTGLDLLAVIQAPDSVLVDTVRLFDDGSHNDGLPSDSLFGNMWSGLPVNEQNYFVDLQTIVTGTDTLWYNNITRFTTTGPIAFDSLYYLRDPVLGPGDYTMFKFALRNDGLVATVNSVEIQLSSLDTNVIILNPDLPPSWGDINPGESNLMLSGRFRLDLTETSPGGEMSIPVALVIASEGNFFWHDTFNIDLTVVLGIDQKGNIPEKFSLHQNYPNPFNPITTIRYELPQRSNVQITIFDLLGREVTSLISETQDAGYKSVNWNATNDLGQLVGAGMYFYQISVGDPSAGSGPGYVQTRKMILLK